MLSYSVNCSQNHVVETISNSKSLIGLLSHYIKSGPSFIVQHPAIDRLTNALRLLRISYLKSVVSIALYSQLTLKEIPLPETDSLQCS